VNDLVVIVESSRSLAIDFKRTWGITRPDNRATAFRMMDRLRKINHPDRDHIQCCDRSQLGRLLLPGSPVIRQSGPQTRAAPAQDFAVNLDPCESDPTRLAPEKRPDRIAVASPGAKPPKHRVELWRALSALLIVILLVESLLSVRWRRARAADEG
jgi:hypothetical protein